MKHSIFLFLTGNEAGLYASLLVNLIGQSWIINDRWSVNDVIFIRLFNLLSNQKWQIELSEVIEWSSNSSRHLI